MISRGVGLDEQLDPNGHAGEVADGVGEHAGVAGPDALGGQRARDAEQERAAVVGETGRTPWNHAAQVAGASWSRRALAPWSQISSAVTGAPALLFPQERPQVWRSWRTRILPEAAVGPEPTGKSASPAAAARGAQRSTGPRARQEGRGQCAPTAFSPALRGPVIRARTLDCFPPPARSLTPDHARSPRGGSFVEAHVPTQQPQAQEDPRFPPPDAHPRWPRRAPVPPRPGPEATLGLIRSVRDRATFEALARARRRRSGPVWLRCASSPSRFGVSRHDDGRHAASASPTPSVARWERGRSQPGAPPAPRRGRAATSTSSLPAGPTCSVRSDACVHRRRSRPSIVRSGDLLRGVTRDDTDDALMADTTTRPFT